METNVSLEKISFLDGGHRYDYDPTTGIIIAYSTPSFLRALTRFTLCGYKPVWEKTIIQRNKLVVESIYENSYAVLVKTVDTTLDELLQSRPDFSSVKNEEVFENTNIDRRTGKPINLEHLCHFIDEMVLDKKVGKQELIDFINTFNVEQCVSGPRLLKLTTAPKKSYGQRAKDYFKELFDKGILLRYTESEYTKKKEYFLNEEKEGKKEA
ncbi:hypothetical protein [Pseudoalteromonas phage J2-1_QLiu-2017]|nr:hypothetical protein [Pseudoalteromonas phage J2-1_QLiu-2017]